MNPYLNTPPTKLIRLLKSETDPQKKAQMKKALEAWREVTGNPLAKSASRIAARYLLQKWFPEIKS